VCIENAGDRAEAATIEQAYREGRAGSATDVRRVIAQFSPNVPFKVVSFLRADGTIIPWSQLNSYQQRTFKAWEYRSTAIPDTLSQEAQRALLDAQEAARTSCK
jgi:hypothetical protein